MAQFGAVRRGSDGGAAVSMFQVGETYKGKNGSDWRSIYAENDMLWCVSVVMKVGNPTPAYCWDQNFGKALNLPFDYDLIPPMPKIEVSDAVRMAVSVDYLPKGGSLDEETARAVIQAWLREHPAALEAFCAESRT